MHGGRDVARESFEKEFLGGGMTSKFVWEGLRILFMFPPLSEQIACRSQTTQQVQLSTLELQRPDT